MKPSSPHPAPVASHHPDPVVERPLNPDRAPRDSRWLPALVVVAGCGLAVAVALALLGAIGALAPVSLPGLPSTTTSVLWALGSACVLIDVSAVATVGLLLAAALLGPGHRAMSTAGYRWTRLAAWPAGVWCTATALSAPLQLADFLGAEPAAVTARGLLSFLTTIPQGQGLAVVGVLTAALAVGSRTVITTGGSLALLTLALTATLPPVLTGHAAGAESHQAAVSGLVMHVLAVVCWSGGLLALVLLRGLPVDVMHRAACRFSQAAPVLVGLVALSGAITAATRLQGPVDLMTTAYGQLVLLKTLALLALGTAGWLHRTRTLPALATGQRGAFRRLAAAEVLGFAATLGVAAALSRTPTPGSTPSPTDSTGETTASEVSELLGFPAPPDPGSGAWWTQLWQPYPDPLWPTLLVILVSGYLLAVRRVASSRQRWPRHRTLAFIGAVAVLALTTSSGLARYAAVSWTAHAGQYLMLALLAPALLLTAAPIRMLTKVTAPTSARRPRDLDDRDLTRWVQSWTTSRVAAAIRRPVVATSLFVIVVYAGATGPVLELVLRSHTAHVISVLATVAAGLILLRSWSRATTASPVPAIMVWLLLHLAASALLWAWPSVLAATWWAEISLEWALDRAADQQAAAALAAAAGALVAGCALIRVTRTTRPSHDGDQLRV